MKIELRGVLKTYRSIRALDHVSLLAEPGQVISATNYYEGAVAAFDDSASGSSPITVTLSANRTPVVITNNSTKNYVFAEAITSPLRNW